MSAGRFNLSRVGLFLVLVAYLGLTAIYNDVNPIFEAPDELAHYNYARYLAIFHTLPLDYRQTGGVLGQEEAGQPPLYYATAALLTFWAPHGDLATLARVNPSGSIGDPRTDGNKNHFLHGPDKSFPWPGEVLTVHLARLSTTLWGLATILLTFLLAREVFASRALALASAAVVAFTPQFVFMSAAVSNDVPAAAASTLFLWLAVRASRSRLSLGVSIGLGAAAGLAVLAKPMTVVALGLAAIALVVAGHRQRLAPSRIAAAIFTMAAATTATCGWWFARNLVAYHTLIPLGTFLARGELFDQMPTLKSALVDLNGLKLSYWALFGWFSILAPPEYYAFFDALTLLALAGGVVALVRTLVPSLRPGRSVDRVGLSLVVLWGALVFLALIGYRLVVLAFQGRLLFPAIGAYAVLLVFGWSRLAPRRAAPALTGVLALALVVPAARAPWTMLAPAYALPPVVDAASIQPRVRLNLRYGDDVQLLGVDVNPPFGSRLAPGDNVQVTLYWQGRRPIARDYVVSVQLDDLAARKLAIVDSMPGRGTLPTSDWIPGKVVVDKYRLRVGGNVAGPAIARISVALYPRETSETLPVYDASGVKLPVAPALGPYVLPGPNDPARAAAGVPFDAQISLVDAALDQNTAHPGDAVSGHLLFAGLAPMTRDYTVFVHLENATGFVAGDDSQPMRGQFPTSFWQPGDLIRHDFQIPLPSNTPAGAYHVRAGWYDLATGQRLATPKGDAVDLGVIEVE